MSIQGVVCDACGAPMKAKVVAPAHVVLGYNLEGGRILKISVPIFAAGHEFKTIQVPIVGNGGEAVVVDGKAQHRDLEVEVKKPQDFDICPKCTHRYVEDAVVQFRRKLEDEEKALKAENESKAL